MIEVSSVDDLISKINQVAPRSSRDYVFKGHKKDCWRLSSTFSRFSTVRQKFFETLAFDFLTKRFIDGLASLGDVDLLREDRRVRLEIARHNGVPSPLIDVTYSPYIALWFAFNGVRGSAEKGNAALYAISLTNLGVSFSKLVREHSDEEAFKKVYQLAPFDFFIREILISSKKVIRKGY